MCWLFRFGVDVVSTINGLLLVFGLPTLLYWVVWGVFELPRLDFLVDTARAGDGFLVHREDGQSSGQA